MLVAIAIPVFTSQLEKSREATDAANIRSAYAEAVVEILENPQTAYNGHHSVTLKQGQANWQNEEAKAGLDALVKAGDAATGDLKVEYFGAYTAVPVHGTVVFNYTIGTGSTPPTLQIAFS